MVGTGIFKRKPYIVVNHVPKCAGSSLRRAFYDAVVLNPDNYFFGKVLYISTITHGNTCIETDGSNFISDQTRLFIDHSKCNKIEEALNINPNKCYKILTIRDPISRIISHNNFFCRFDTEELLNNEELFNKLIGICGNLICNYSKNDLEQYDFIFNCSDFNRSVGIFNSINPYDLKLSTVRTNCTPYTMKQYYSDILLDRIRQAIPEEIEIYERAKSLCEID